MIPPDSEPEEDLEDDTPVEPLGSDPFSFRGSDLRSGVHILQTEAAGEWFEEQAAEWCMAWCLCEARHGFGTWKGVKHKEASLRWCLSSFAGA